MAKRKSREAPLRREDDSAKMTETIDWLKKSGWDFFRPTHSQLKIDGDISFYPDTGTLMLDGYSTRCSESGLGALQELLRERELS